MGDVTATALVFAAAPVVLGAATGLAQVRGLRRLAARRHVPSDERAYLRARYRRRLVTAGVLVAVGGLIAGAYLSGLEGRTDELAEPRAQPGDGPAPKREMTPDERHQFRVWGLYWIGVIVLVFAAVTLALADVWATRQYWLAQYRQLKDEHQAKLRRDLAVYRQHKESTRGGRFKNQLGNPDDTPEP